MRRSAIVELSCGSVICGEERIDRLTADWFSRSAWLALGAREHVATGRAAVLIGNHDGETWVLRHFRRGGFVARFVDDHYLWLGLENSRAFREWRLLRQMSEWGLPSPEPIAACVKRTGVLYQADIVTMYLEDTRPLSALLRDDGVDEGHWRRIGSMLRQFHDRGVCHPDLTAHNILVDSTGKTYLVDFDSADTRPQQESWQRKGLARLQRSLRKVALETGTNFDPEAWATLVAAYRA